MEHEPKSIGEQIETLAQLTGAPESFVDQVRDLFAKKGISLHEDATPYVRALEEAFIREESIRASTERAHENVQRVGHQLHAVGKAYVEQIERLRRTQNGRRAQGPGPGKSPAKSRRTISGQPLSGRTLVTRQQREDMPMVPGPEELQ